MKKYLFSILACIAAVALNSFIKKNSKNNTNTLPLYWFEVKPEKGSLYTFRNIDVKIQESSLNTGPTLESLDGQICSAYSEIYKCVIGFDPSDVSSSTGALLDNNGTCPIVPIVIEQIRDDE